MAALRMNNLIWPVGAVYYYYTTNDPNNEINSTTNPTFNGKHPIVIFGGTWQGPTTVQDSDGTTIYKFVRTA